MEEHCLGMTGIVVRFYVGAPISGFGEMDIISVFETEGGSSILSSPAKKTVDNYCKRLYNNIFNTKR